jgi:aryl-alcohol dehydrogenase-like predicted oxidoreductase
MTIVVGMPRRYREAMQYRILGRTGVKVTPLCLGTMNFGGRTDAAESHRILDQYLELGGNFVDTANV